MSTIPRNKTFFSVSILFLVVLALTLPVHPSRTRAERPTTHPGNFKPGSGAKRITTPSAPQHVTMPHLLAASYYSLNGGLSPTLMLSNQGPHSMNIDVTLFSLSGTRLAAPTITLAGNTVRGFDLSEWAVAGGPDFREGSLQVMYTGGDMELSGVVRLVDADRSLIFDEELSEPMMFASSRLEGVWWLPSHKTEMLLGVSNTADAPLSVKGNEVAPDFHWEFVALKESNKRASAMVRRKSNSNRARATEVKQDGALEIEL